MSIYLHVVVFYLFSVIAKSHGITYDHAKSSRAGDLWPWEKKISATQVKKQKYNQQ
jgi:hypothetical protein